MKCISFKSLSGLILAGVFLAGAVGAEAQTMTGVTDVTMWGSRRGFFRTLVGDSYAPNGQSGSTCSGNARLSCTQRMSGRAPRSQALKPFFCTARRPFTFHERIFTPVSPRPNARPVAW